MWNHEIDFTDNSRISFTNLGFLKRLVAKIEEDLPEEVLQTEVLIPFEFIIGSLFPTSYEAIKNAMTQQYIEGYNCGKKEAEENANSRVN